MPLLWRRYTSKSNPCEQTMHKKMCIFPSYSKTRVSARIDECGSGNVIETGTRKIAFETEEIFSSTVFTIHTYMTT